jgi:hypothetical protein
MRITPFDGARLTLSGLAGQARGKFPHLAGWPLSINGLSV